MTSVANSLAAKGLSLTMFAENSHSAHMFAAQGFHMLQEVLTQLSGHTMIKQKDRNALEIYTSTLQRYTEFCESEVDAGLK